jgi:glycosyltransferase involved in cell wall biosynthesis
MYGELFEEMGHDVNYILLDNHNNIKDWGKKWVDRVQRKHHSKYDIAIVQKPPYHNDDYMQFKEIQTAGKKVWHTLFECDRWPDEWEPIIKDFDIITTASNWQMAAAKKTLPDKKIMLTRYPLEPTFSPNNGKGDFNFYSEFSRITERKNLEGLLKAYFLGFNKSDNVKLTIKIPGNPTYLERFYETFEYVKKCFEFKREKFPEIHLCSQYVTDKQMDNLMAKADCYISPSKGEGFEMPLATAAINGIPVLYPKTDLEGCWGEDYAIEDYAYSAAWERAITTEYIMHGFILDTTKCHWLNPHAQDLSKMMWESIPSQPERLKMNVEKSRKVLSKESIKAQWKEVFNL